MSAPPLPERIDRYRVVRELGRGGMGVVVLAERDDGEYRRQVAIKLLAGGRERGDRLAARLRSERQILAALDHPGIAKLLDGGALADGSPFLVMEFVEGERIDRWCDERSLPIRPRLALVLRVCDAVEAAHRRLIVHRDLKPGNILVTPEGAVKLLDFGIAKLLDPASVDWTVDATEFGASPLTLRYASPEQVRGEPIGTESDVYSLGVVLYELVAGRSPYAASRTLPELSRAICESDPPPPSAAVAAPTDDRTVDGWSGPTAPPPRPGVAAPPSGIDRDLDAVVLKSLRKNPAERYPTIAALADDLGRYLDGRPVEARRGSRLYRARKFVARHRWAVAAAGAFAVTVALFVVGLARQLEQTRVERDHARAVTDFLIDAFRGADPERGAGPEPTAREALDRGAARAAANLESRPEILGRVLHAIGKVYVNLGAPDRAAEELERAVALRRADRDRDPEGYAAVLVDLGMVVREQNRFDRAESLFVEALELLDRHPPASPAERRRVRADARNGLATVYVERGDLARAERLFRELLADELAALGLVEPPGASGPPLAAEYRPLGSRLHNLGAMNIELGRYEEAVGFLHQALAVKSRYADPHPGSVAHTLEALGNARGIAGRHAEALEHHERALSLRRGLYGDGHPLVAQSQVTRANDLSGLGRHEEALAETRRARAIWESLHGREHALVATAYENEARDEWALGALDAAEEHQRVALAIRERVFGAEHPATAAALHGLGGILAARGRPGEALALQRRAVAVSLGVLGATHPDALDQRLALAKLELALGDARSVVPELESLVRELERSGREGSLADARFALARALVETAAGRDRALALARRALDAIDGRAAAVGIASAAEIEAWLGAAAASAPGP